MRRIDDLDEYHTEIERYVTTHLDARQITAVGNADGVEISPIQFVFQDETPEHFNHDVLLECKRRLG